MQQPQPVDGLSQRLVQSPEVKSWNRAVIFTDSQILVTTFNVAPENLRPFLTAFGDRDTTIANGFSLFNEHFDVHKWSRDYVPCLAHGRRGDALQGEGIALAQAGNVFMLVTYVYPIVAAKAVADLRDFVRRELIGTS